VRGLPGLSFPGARKKALTRGKQENPRTSGFPGIRGLPAAATGVFEVPEIRLIRPADLPGSRGTAASNLLIDKI
jgi:hypothetical protein